MDEELNGGVVEQEEAAPASDLDNIAQDEPVEQEPDPETVEESAEEPEQEPERPGREDIPNHVWAAARKRAEAEEKARVDREFARRCEGKKNPLTGQPIRTMQEYWAAIDAQNELRRQRAIEAATKGIDAQQAAAIREALTNDPEKARMKARIDDLERREIANSAAVALENDLRELSKIDPSIKNVHDLEVLPEFGDIVELVKKGYSLGDAYKVTRYDQVRSASEKSGRQAAINAARSKNHLAKHGGNSAPGNMKAIPAKQLAFFKEQFPDKSMDELTKLYNQTI